MRPVFISENVTRINTPRIIGNNQNHLLCSFKQEGSEKVFDCIGFNMGDYYDILINSTDDFNIVYTIDKIVRDERTFPQFRLKDIQNNLVKRADEYFKKNLHEAKSFGEMKNILEKKGGLVKIQWCGRKDCAEDMKEKTNGGAIRGTMFGKAIKPRGTCINCNGKSTQVVYIAKQY